jgi:ATP-binding cassette subfamily B protein
MLDAKLEKSLKPLKYCLKLVIHFWPGFVAIGGMLIARGIHTIFTPKYVGQIISVISNNGPSTLLRAILPLVIKLILVIILLHASYRIVLYLFYIKTEPRIYAKIEQECLSKILYKSTYFFEKYGPGLLSGKISDLQKSTDNFFEYLHNWSLPSLFTVMISGVYLLRFDILLSLSLFLPIITTVSTVIFYANKLKNAENEHYKANSVAIDKLIDVLSNSLCVRLFCRYNYEIQAQRQRHGRIISTSERANWVYFSMFLAYDLGIVCMIVAQFAILIHKSIHGSISPEDFSLVVIQNGLIQANLWQIVIGIPTVSWAYSSINSALAVIDDGDIQDDTVGKHLEVTQGKIEYRNVTFHYSKSDTLFEDLSFIIEPGESWGIVGSSGAGKSSLINLLLKLYTLQSGQIMIDNQDIMQVRSDSLRNSIAVVPQSPMLFSGSIYSNLLYGRLSATEEEIIEVAKSVKMHKVILGLEKGYDSDVSILSGGQKQRISIARAILKNAPILVIDEGTSSLDSITEKWVQESIVKASRGRTTLIIAHRLSTLINVDKIAVFSAGKLVETGNHAELLAKNGEYCRLYNAGLIKNTTEENRGPGEV